MATVIDKDTRPEVQRDPEAPRRSRSGTVLAAAIVLVGLLGFGIGWLVFRDTGTDVPDEVEELLADFETGWNQGDGEAVVAVMGPGARHYYEGFRDGVAGDDLVALVDRLGVNDQFQDFETVSVVGDDPYVVVQRGTVYGADGYSVYHVAEVGGELRIVMHYWVD